MNEIELFEDALRQLAAAKPRWGANYRLWLRWEDNVRSWYINRIKRGAQQGLPMAQELWATFIACRLGVAHEHTAQTI